MSQSFSLLSLHLYLHFLNIVFLFFDCRLSCFIVMQMQQSHISKFFIFQLWKVIALIVTFSHHIELISVSCLSDQY